MLSQLTDEQRSWSRDDIINFCDTNHTGAFGVTFNDKSLPGRAWGSLNKNLGMELRSLRSLISFQDNVHYGAVMFDSPVERVCPQMLEKIKPPSVYFPRDLHVNSNPTGGATKAGSIWPSLFVSKNGTWTGLHTDSDCVSTSPPLSNFGAFVHACVFNKRPGFG